MDSGLSLIVITSKSLFNLFKSGPLTSIFSKNVHLGESENFNVEKDFLKHRIRRVRSVCERYLSRIKDAAVNS